LSVLSPDADTTRRQSGEIATLCHYDGDRSSQKYSGRRTPHGPGIRVPFQRRHAFAGLDVPHLERAVVRTRHDAPPVQRYGNAKDLQRRHVITKVQRTPQRTSSECPFSVATHLPVSMFHTLSSRDPETMCCPSGNTSMQPTYNEDTSSQKYSGRRGTHAIQVPIIDLRRRQIITKVQWTPQRTRLEFPSSVATHSPVATSHTLSVLSGYIAPDTTRRPSGEIATLVT